MNFLLKPRILKIKTFLFDALNGKNVLSVKACSENAEEMIVVFEYLFLKLLKTNRYDELKSMIACDVNKKFTCLSTFKYLTCHIAKIFVKAGLEERAYITDVHKLLMEQVMLSKNLPLSLDDFTEFILVNDCLPLFENIWMLFYDEISYQLIYKLKHLIGSVLKIDYTRVRDVIRVAVNNIIFINELKDKMFYTLFVPFFTMEQFEEHSSVQELCESMYMSKQEIVQSLVICDNVELLEHLLKNGFCDDLIIFPYHLIIGYNSINILNLIRCYEFKNSNLNFSNQSNNGLVIKEMCYRLNNNAIDDKIMSLFLEMVDSKYLTFSTVSLYNAKKSFRVVMANERYDFVGINIMRMLICDVEKQGMLSTHIISEIVLLFVRCIDNNDMSTMNDYLKKFKKFYKHYDLLTVDTKIMDMSMKTICRSIYTVPWLLLMGRHELVDMSLDDFNERNFELEFSRAIAVDFDKHTNTDRNDFITSIPKESVLMIKRQYNDFNFSELFIHSLMIFDEESTKNIYKIDKKQCVATLVEYSMTNMCGMHYHIDESIIDFIIDDFLDTEKINLCEPLSNIIMKNDHVMIMLKHGINLFKSEKQLKPIIDEMVDSIINSQCIYIIMYNKEVTNSKTLDISLDENKSMLGVCRIGILFNNHLTVKNYELIIECPRFMYISSINTSKTLQKTELFKYEQKMYIGHKRDYSKVILHSPFVFFGDKFARYIKYPISPHALWYFISENSEYDEEFLVRNLLLNDSISVLNKYLSKIWNMTFIKQNVNACIAESTSYNIYPQTVMTLLENNKITIDDISDSYVFSSKLVHNLVPKYIPNVDTAIMEAYKKDFVEDVRITRTFMFALENYKIGETLTKKLIDHVNYKLNSIDDLIMKHIFLLMCSINMNMNLFDDVPYSHVIKIEDTSKIHGICSICLYDEVSILLPCEHCFCLNCFETLIDTKICVICTQNYNKFYTNSNFEMLKEEEDRKNALINEDKDYDIVNNLKYISFALTSYLMSKLQTKFRTNNYLSKPIKIQSIEQQKIKCFTYFENFIENYENDFTFIDRSTDGVPQFDHTEMLVDDLADIFE
jgi:hypothetical protein